MSNVISPAGFIETAVSHNGCFNIRLSARDFGRLCRELNKISELADDSLLANLRVALGHLRHDLMEKIK